MPPPAPPPQQEEEENAVPPALKTVIPAAAPPVRPQKRLTLQRLREVGRSAFVFCFTSTLPGSQRPGLKVGG